MGIFYEHSIVYNGLVFAVDPNTPRSHMPGTVTCYDIISRTPGTLPDYVTGNSQSFIFGTKAPWGSGINFGNILDINPGTSNFTIGIWVKIVVSSPNDETYSSLIGRSFLGNLVGYGLGINYDSEKFWFQARNMYDVSECYSNPYTLNAWQYVVVVRIYGDYLKMYVNGRLSISSTVIDNYSCGPSTWTEFLIGANSSTFPYHLSNAEIGHSHMYNRALSENEVLTNYNMLKGRYGL